MNYKVKNKQIKTFPVLIEQDEDDMYIGTVPSLRSCCTQGETLPELYKNLEEVIGLCMDVEQNVFN